MADALAWMDDPAEFDALVREIFVEYDDEENTPRVTEAEKRIDPAWRRVDPELGSEPIYACKFVVRLFESPSFLLDRYTPAQVDAGIYRLLSWGELAWFPVGVNNEQIPIEDRVRCLRSAERLYRDLFAPMYGDQVSSLGEREGDIPGFTCFMWWDIATVWPVGYEPSIDLGFDNPFDLIRAVEDELEPSEPAIDDILINELFDLFGRVLELDSDECRASVLHGIGHHEDMHPKRARATVAKFLKRNPDLRPKLREYAEKAAQGHVL